MTDCEGQDLSTSLHTRISVRPTSLSSPAMANVQEKNLRRLPEWGF